MGSAEKLTSVEFEVFGRVQVNVSFVFRHEGGTNSYYSPPNSMYTTFYLTETYENCALDFTATGVFFRKYTEKEANRLGLKGWCMNTSNNTVLGVVEGVPSKINQMKDWLQHTGSPQSRIDKAVFKNEKDIVKYTYDSFKIKR